jgi:hypothetical protein
MARAIAAILIAVFALVGVGSPAGAEPPRGWRGRGRGRGHYRPHYRPHYENPLPGILGGILGGWLSQQLKPAEPPRRYEDEEDDAPRDRR